MSPALRKRPRSGSGSEVGKAKKRKMETNKDEVKVAKGKKQRIGLKGKLLFKNATEAALIEDMPKMKPPQTKKMPKKQRVREAKVVIPKRKRGRPPMKNKMKIDKEEKEVTFKVTSTKKRDPSKKVKDSKQATLSVPVKKRGRPKMQKNKETTKETAKEETKENAKAKAKETTNGSLPQEKRRRGRPKKIVVQKVTVSTSFQPVQILDHSTVLNSEMDENPFSTDSVFGKLSSELMLVSPRASPMKPDSSQGDQLNLYLDLTEDEEDLSPKIKTQSEEDFGKLLSASTHFPNRKLFGSNPASEADPVFGSAKRSLTGEFGVMEEENDSKDEDDDQGINGHEMLGFYSSDQDEGGE